MNETYFSRQHLLWECDIAHLALDLRHSPRRIGILTIFITSAINQSVQDTYIVTGFIVWFVLWLILRPTFIHALQYTRIAEILGLLQLPLRWLIFIICSVYLWYAGSTSTEMWWILVLFVLDLFMTWGFERRAFLAIEQRKAFLQTQPSIIVTERNDTGDDL